MKSFVLKELVTTNIESELEKIGFDIAYRAKAADKFVYKTFKIFDLTLPQANILKQTALSFGADCGVHKNVLVNQIEKTDVILGGSYSQLKKICEKLKFQPFALKFLAEKILAELDLEKRKTKLVGILNVTPDSFSDGGKYFDPNEARKKMFQLIEDGADAIDIGAESTRPGANIVNPEEQIKRLTPVLKNLPDIPISIDTRSSEVARFALDNGVSIVNDVSGLDYDYKMLDIVAEYGAGLIIQHSAGASENRPRYNDLIEDVYFAFLKKIDMAKEKGVKNLILDVGIGFGKSANENFEILKRINEYHSLHLPLMVGVSRKSFLGVKENNNELKDALSAAVSYPLINKVDFLRVHNIYLHKQLLNSVI